MRWVSTKSSGATGRPGHESSLLGHPNANFFGRNEVQAQKTKKRAGKTKLALRQITTVMSRPRPQGLAMNARYAGALDPASGSCKNTFRAISIWPVLK
jgi:hypothetical protein